MKDDNQLEAILEALVFASPQPLSIEQLQKLLPENLRLPLGQLRASLQALQIVYQDRAVELCEVASGWRFQVRQQYADSVVQLWEEKPARYSRAFLETLALVAYRQPITRAEIEDIRGVTGSSSITKTLMEHGWIRIVGHKEVPSRPALFATTKVFLDHFGFKSLEDLPALADMQDLLKAEKQLELDLQHSAANQEIGLEVPGVLLDAHPELGPVEQEEAPMGEIEELVDAVVAADEAIAVMLEE